MEVDRKQTRSIGRGQSSFSSGDDDSAQEKGEKCRCKDANVIEKNDTEKDL